MLSNYLAAALRNLWRNRLHAAITTLSLAVGFAAIILAVLYWRYEHNYDRFWPDAERLHMAIEWHYSAGAEGSRPTMVADSARAEVAALVRDIPGVEASARATYERTQFIRGGGTRVLDQTTLWTDPGLFAILKPRVIAGDIETALDAPDSLVVTRRFARMHFGKDAPLGEAISASPAGWPRPQRPVLPLRVTAVIEDPPQNSHLAMSAFLSGRSPASPLRDPKLLWTQTYFKVRPGVDDRTLAPAFAELTQRLAPTSRGRPELKALPIQHAYMKPLGYGGGAHVVGNTRFERADRAVGYLALAALLAIIAAINFITLMTAKGAQRALEVGVRKAAGASRVQLVVQFLGEAVLHALLAFVLAVALVEMALPLVNGATGRVIDLDHVREAGLLGQMLLGALLVGALAGVYPAFALSSFRPAQSLKAGSPKAPGSALLRQILIGAQFTPLLLLALGALTLDRAARAAEANTLRMLDPNAVLIREDCLPAVMARVAAIPGVRSVACIDVNSTGVTPRGHAIVIGEPNLNAPAKVSGHPPTYLNAFLTDRQALDFHGLRPLAGRLWETPADERTVIVNETGARYLGFAKPASAVGAVVEWRRTEAAPAVQSTILGVVADRAGLRDFEKVLYFQDRTAKRQNMGIGVKLTGTDVAASMAGFDEVWAETGGTGFLVRDLYSDWVSRIYADEQRNARFFTASAGVGIVMAMFGLFGLAAFLAEQRTKEIGVRKALGASRPRLLALLLFQFARPVLIANLIACPAAWIGFELLQQQVAPADRPHPGAAEYALVLAVSLALTLAATSLHAWRVTGARPVTALRYE